MQTPTVAEILGWLGNQAVYGWASALAELLIAMAIMWELRQNRIAHLMDEAFNRGMREDQSRIYQEFAKLTNGTLAEKRQRFSETAMATDSLRSVCDHQIVRFSSIWFLWRGRWFSRARRFVSWPHKELDTWFPHVVVPFWVIAGRYVIERSRIRGRWTSHYVAAFTFRSIRFLEKECQETSVMLGGERLTVTKEVLAIIKQEVQSLM